MNKFDEEAVEQSVKDFLIAIGEDIDREGLKDTPRRVTKFWKEILEGQFYTNEEIAEMYRKDFHVSYKLLRRIA